MGSGILKKIGLTFRVVGWIPIFCCLLLFCLTSRAQISRYNWRVRDQGFLGFTKVDWSGKSQFVYRGYDDLVWSFGNTSGLSMGWYNTSDRETGLAYDFTAMSIGEGENTFSDRSRIHELKMYKSLVRGCFLEERSHNISTFRFGISRMNTRETNPFLLSYSTPYEIRTRWWGANVGLESGASYRIGNSQFRLEWAVTFQYTFLLRTRLWTSSNDLEYEGDGMMRINSLGLQVSLLHFQSGMNKDKN